MALRACCMRAQLCDGLAVKNARLFNGQHGGGGSNQKPVSLVQFNCLIILAWQDELTKCRAATISKKVRAFSFTMLGYKKKVFNLQTRKYNTCRTLAHVPRAQAAGTITAASPAPSALAAPMSSVVTRKLELLSAVASVNRGELTKQSPAARNHIAVLVAQLEDAGAASLADMDSAMMEAALGSGKWELVYSSVVRVRLSRLGKHTPLWDGPGCAVVVDCTSILSRCWKHRHSCDRAAVKEIQQTVSPVVASDANWL
jgi:hypothetical protein